MEIISGIYKITNLITCDFYIGSSKNIYLRWRDHKKPSTLKRCKNQKMYKDFLKYNISNFKFEILYKALPKDDIKIIESNYIQALHPTYNNLNFLPKKYNDINRICGVYKIENKITHEFYIGSSKDIKARWHCHKNSNNYKKHPNSKLYKAMSEYGIKNFDFDIIEECSEKDLLKKEQYYIDSLHPRYNVGTAKAKLSSTEYQKQYRQKYAKAIKEKRNIWKNKNKKHESDRNKNYYHRLCLYNNEFLTLCALSARFRKQGIISPTTEAKKYLV